MVADKGAQVLTDPRFTSTSHPYLSTIIISPHPVAVLLLLLLQLCAVVFVSCGENDVVDEKGTEDWN